MNTLTHTELTTVAPTIDLEVKKWIYANPHIYESKTFLSDCEYSDRIGKRRFTDVRKSLIKSLLPWERSKFTHRNNHGKRRGTTIRVRRWILNHPKLPYHCFLHHYNISGNEVQKHIASKISERSFKAIRSEMVKNGEINRAYSKTNQDLFLNNNV